MTKTYRMINLELFRKILERIITKAVSKKIEIFSKTPLKTPAEQKKNDQKSQKTPLIM